MKTKIFENPFVLGIIALMVIGGIALAVSGSQQMSFYPGGMSILSISQINLRTENIDGSSMQIWRVLANINQNAEYIEATINKEQLVSGSMVATNDVQIKARVVENKCVYNFQLTDSVYEDIYTLENLRKVILPYCNANEIWLAGGYCVTRIPQARTGNIITPTQNKKFGVTFEITSHGQKGTAYVNSYGKGTEVLKVGTATIGRVQMQGGLDTGYACQYANNLQLIGAYKVTTKDHIAISFKAHSDWKHYRDAEFNYCILQEAALGIFGDETKCINQFNTKAGAALVPQRLNNMFVSSKSANIEQTPPNLVAFPQVTLDISADWVGVVQAVGMPKITMASDNIEVTGEFKTPANVYVKNIGVSSGTFDVSLQCYGGFYANPASTRIVLKPQEETKTTFYIGKGGSVSGSNYCDVRVVDTTDSSRIDTARINAKYTAGSYGCSPEGSKFCSGNDLITCVGGTYVATSCPFGCDSQALICKSDDSAKCGDGLCEREKGETDRNCPEDCGSEICPPWTLLDTTAIGGGKVTFPDFICLAMYVLGQLLSTILWLAVILVVGSVLAIVAWGTMMKGKKSPINLKKIRRRLK